jgi:polar amino acid transport system substrate-binding protein
MKMPRLRARSLASFASLVLLVLYAAFGAAEGDVGDSGRLMPGRSAAAKVLRIGVGDNYPPFAYVEGGKTVGYWVDLMKETASVLGYAPEITAGVWDAVKADVLAGRLDVAASMADLPERRSVFELSVPVSTTAYAIWGRRGAVIESMADMKGKKVVLQKGSLMADSTKLRSSGAVISLVPEDADALVLLDSGRYDAAILPIVQGMYVVKKLKLANVLPSKEAVFSVSQCFAVAKGNERLARELDAGLGILKQSGKFDEIYAKWLGVYHKPMYRRIPAWLLALRWTASDRST